MRDYRYYQRKRELAAQRAAQDRRDAERHRQFDLQAQDTVAKFERPHFAVVTATEAFRRGWDAIFGEGQS